MNSLFLIESKVVIRVRGIAGPFNLQVGWLVNAQSISEARAKYEKQVRQDQSHMQFESIEFDYIKQIGEIK